MPEKVNPIPDGYHSLTPYLIVDDGARALEFYKRAFGATELFRMEGPDGRIGHAEIRIGNSHVMLADEHPEINARSPRAFGGSPMSLMLYVEDVDSTVSQAVEAGAKLTRPVENQFYGDRTGGLEDPFGHAWYVATHVEDVPAEELKKRAAAAGH
ncbi:MAG TPA: VOC family protein [Pyrinomonadaceae bacterium]|jgi:PhnB protein